VNNILRYNWVETTVARRIYYKRQH